MKRSEQIFLRKLPRFSAKDRKATLVIFDHILTKWVPGFSTWISRFPNAYPVKAGESLKSLRSYSDFCERVSRTAPDIRRSNGRVLGIGGGSVGDFSGFFASTYLRGLPLELLPTTWLSAIDSAHGGKTALNLLNHKNQIGTFYPARKIYLVRGMLEVQGKSLEEQAWGELAKIAILDGGKWTYSLNRASLWSVLPQAIEAKWKWVLQDPLETKGIRHALNLGHTWGHVLEAAKGLSHGEAVLRGIRFALQWSFEKNYLSERDRNHLIQFLGSSRSETGPLSRKQATAHLLRDKKIDPKGLRFVFLKSKSSGSKNKIKPFFESVTLPQLLKELERQGWLKV